ncbi:hypothetical protein A6R68_16513, partial [Neotoma lepida]
MNSLSCQQKRLDNLGKMMSASRSPGEEAKKLWLKLVDKGAYEPKILSQKKICQLASQDTNDPGNEKRKRRQEPILSPELCFGVRIPS